MPLPRSIHQYSEFQSVLSAARAQSGAVYRVPDPPGKRPGSRATMWRQKAYYYRKLLAEQNALKHGDVPGYVGLSEWDDMLLTVDPRDPTAIRIEFGVVTGKLESLSGAALAVERVRPIAERLTTTADADLLDLAEQLALEIGK